MIWLNTLSHPRLIALFKADVNNIKRDPIMALTIILSLFLPFVLWHWRPSIDNYAVDAFNIKGFSHYIVSFTLVLPGLLLGWITGMLLLEDRDDGPLLALEITPLGKVGFLFYRATVTALVSFLVTLVVVKLLLDVSLFLHLFLALLVAMEAVMITFALVELANNKVEGLALSKVLNIAALFPLLALLSSPLRYFAAIVPSYAIGEILHSDTLPVVVVYSLALLIHIVVLVGLFCLSLRRVG